MPRLSIDDGLVGRVARRLAATRRPAGVPGSRGAVGASAERLLRDQPEVLAFLLAGTGQLAGETRGVGVFLAEVIFDAFRLAGRNTRSVEPVRFVHALRDNRDMAMRVGQAHDRIAERYLRNSRTLRQPALIRYVTGVLLEPDPTCPHTMPRDELGPLFIVLKSVIDVLDHDAGRPVEGVALSSEPA
jgi:hypothetical protein